MPYTLRVERLASQRRWYANHPGAKDKVVSAKRRYQARNAQLVDQLLAERCPCGSVGPGHLEERRKLARRVARIPTSAAKVTAFIEGCDGA